MGCLFAVKIFNSMTNINAPRMYNILFCCLLKVYGLDALFRNKTEIFMIFYSAM